jgi:hypothetical protein
MIKIINLLCFFLLIATVVFSQTNDFRVLNEPKVLGKNYINGSDIVGVELKFPDRIDDYFIDTSTGFLTVQLRGPVNNGRRLNNVGNILQYNLKDAAILWTKTIDYDKCRLLQFDKQLILNDINGCYNIDAETGYALWGVRDSIFLCTVDFEKNMGFAYKFREKEGYTNELLGIDFSKGKQMWNREINKEYDWNDCFYLNDSTFMVVAAGLHTINIYTGKGWDYNTVTGKVIKINEKTSYDSDYSGYYGYYGYYGSSSGSIIAGALIGLVGALIYTAIAEMQKPMNQNQNPIPTTALVRDFVSNTLVDSAFCYLASQEQLVKLDKNSGEIIWKYPFKKNLATKSSIFMDDNFIYMINYGYALKYDTKLYYGKPFIAAFDKQSGDQKYFSLFKNGVFVDYKIIDNEVYLLFRNQIIKYNLETGTQIYRKIYPKESLNQLTYFAENDMFTLNKNGVLWNPVQNDSTNLSINTNQRKIISIDNQLKVTNTIGYKDTFNYLLQYNDHQFIANSEKTIVVNKNGVIIAELSITSNAFLLDDVLYEKKYNSFIAIDLKNINF